MRKIAAGWGCGVEHVLEGEAGELGSHQTAGEAPHLAPGYCAQYLLIQQDLYLPLNILSITVADLTSEGGRQIRRG